MIFWKVDDPRWHVRGDFTTQKSGGKNQSRFLYGIKVVIEVTARYPCIVLRTFRRANEQQYHCQGFFSPFSWCMHTNQEIHSLYLPKIHLQSSVNLPRMEYIW